MNRRGQLFDRRRLDHLPHPRELTSVVCSDLEFQGVGICNGVEHPAVGDVDSHLTKLWHRHHLVQRNDKSRHVLERHTLDFARRHRCLDANEAGRRL